MEYNTLIEQLRKIQYIIAWRSYTSMVPGYIAYISMHARGYAYGIKKPAVFVLLEVRIRQHSASDYLPSHFLLVPFQVKK